MFEIMPPPLRVVVRGITNMTYDPLESGLS